MIVVSEPSTVVHRVGTVTDDTTRALVLQAQAMCTKAANYLEEQDDFEEERDGCIHYTM